MFNHDERNPFVTRHLDVGGLLAAGAMRRWCKALAKSWEIGQIGTGHSVGV